MGAGRNNMPPASPFIQNVSEAFESIRNIDDTVTSNSLAKPDNMSQMEGVKTPESMQQSQYYGQDRGTTLSPTMSKPMARAGGK